MQITKGTEDTEKLFGAAAKFPNPQGPPRRPQGAPSEQRRRRGLDPLTSRHEDCPPVKQQRGPRLRAWLYGNFRSAAGCMRICVLEESEALYSSSPLWESCSLLRAATKITPCCHHTAAMVWTEDWGSFALAVRDIFAHSPTTARFSLKYRRSEALLSAKVADDISCVKYRATSPSELRRLERLAAAFMSWASQPNPKLGGPPLSLEGIIEANAGASAAKSEGGSRRHQQQRRCPQQQKHASVLGDCIWPETSAPEDSQQQAYLGSRDTASTGGLGMAEGPCWSLNGDRRFDDRPRGPEGNRSSEAPLCHSSVGVSSTSWQGARKLAVGGAHALLVWFIKHAKESIKCLEAAATSKQHQCSWHHLCAEAAKAIQRIVGSFARAASQFGLFPTKKGALIGRQACRGSLKFPKVLMGAHLGPRVAEEG
ncbi:signal recognition particle domain-containing protein [Cyclospora cayetanensis]|uniref:Signal recognition particle domain-containing protein n=1 Tax=Cyclospora cayetanensis TaxID=88456 RepID=A0A1D3D5W4_9EIME|nr:signal recognition particle domain-containing protein [Cyclospora cayetanensis]